MGFITDKEKIKEGLIIFRRGDVAHDNFYCRIRSKKQVSEGSGLESQEATCREHADMLPMTAAVSR